jgi:ketosteroid isomerase-like protein
MDTGEVVSRCFDCASSGRWDDYLALFTDDVVIDEQGLGHCEGIDHVRRGIEVFRHNPGLRNHLREIVVEGDRAVAICQVTVPLPDGRSARVEVANFYRVQGGKITYFASYHDAFPLPPAATH